VVLAKWRDLISRKEEQRVRKGRKGDGKSRGFILWINRNNWVSDVESINYSVNAVL